MRIKRIDLFAFGIAYNDPTNFGINENPMPLYNGNISQMVWNSASMNTTVNPVSRRYSYEYDALNRIVNATDNTGNYDLGNVSYDKMGNILTLQRQGHVNTGATSFGTMDDLAYTYDGGNRLLKVADTGNKVHGFRDGVNTNDDFEYDVNGNLRVDRNKGITGITYNHLNLPDTVTTTQGNISYVYDATGTKLQKTVSVGSSVTDYAGNYIYQDRTLQFFSQPEGYVTPDGMGGYDNVYQYKDHLGNIRLSYVEDDNGDLEIVEENNYYPFGLKHKGYNDNGISPLGNDVAQKWKFGGKELDEDFGLNWYHYGFRMYDPVISRFPSIDPKSDEFPYVSTYNYAENRPIDGIDLWGLQYVNANDARLFVNTSGTAKLNFQNMTMLTRNTFNSINSNPDNWKPGNIGAHFLNTSVTDFKFESTRDSKSLRLGKPTNWTIRIQKPIAESTGQEDRRFKDRYVGTGPVSSGKSVKSARALLVVEGVKLSYDLISLTAEKIDGNILEGQFTSLLYSAVDLENALDSGLIPEDYQNTKDLSLLLNGIFMGEGGNPNDKRDQAIVNYGRMIYQLYNQQNNESDEE